MRTPIFFVSDNHFQKKSNLIEVDRRKKFYNLLEHINKERGTLVIGGDFFDFWFNYKGYVPYGYLDIFEKRLFSSRIIMESNIMNRQISDYMIGLDALLEANRIQEEIFNIEHDLWEY